MKQGVCSTIDIGLIELINLLFSIKKWFNLITGESKLSENSTKLLLLFRLLFSTKKCHNLIRETSNLREDFAQIFLLINLLLSINECHNLKGGNSQSKGRLYLNFGYCWDYCFQSKSVII